MLFLAELSIIKAVSEFSFDETITCAARPV